MSLWARGTTRHAGQYPEWPGGQCPRSHTSGIMTVVPSHACMPSCCPVSFLFLSEPVTPSSGPVWTLEGPPAGLARAPVCSITNPRKAFPGGYSQRRVDRVSPSFKMLQGMVRCLQRTGPNSFFFLVVKNTNTRLAILIIFRCTAV